MEKKETEDQKGTIPVSPEVINFVHSLDGREKKDTSDPKHFDKQWKRGLFYTDQNFVKFFRKLILEE